MATTLSQAQKPEPTLQQNEKTQADEEDQEHFDPCSNAQKFSPFYMYNHDSPRPSAELRPTHKPSTQTIHVDVRDLELGDITPSVTQEKINANQKPHSKTLLHSLKFWEKPCQQSLTRPKKQWWLQRLPKKQRIAVRAVITILIIGTMVGIAVGIAAALNSGVNGSTKTVGEHKDS